MIRNKILPLALISATLITSSCSFFNPEYERPKIKAPALWNNQDKNIEVTKNWDLTKVAWWREFNDPVLNNLITTALKDNNKLQVSIGNILQANAEINK
ncbi:TolC family protein, partial [Francisella tularensis]|nr:TolC family protein [Francisella tularensis]